MLNNVALDVFIGLVFIYLLYSLLASVVQELIARVFCLRARMLQKSLRRMLEDENRDLNKYWQNASILTFPLTILNDIQRYFIPFKEGKDEFLKSFYAHPSIKYLGEGAFNSKPAYLEPSTFSETMIHLLRGPAYDGRLDNESQSIQQSLDNNTLKISEETRKHLRMLFADAKGDSITYKRKLEDWYNEVQARATAWYKRQNQVFLIAIGLGLAASFNVDSIAISQILISNKTARDTLVSMAGNKIEIYNVKPDSPKPSDIELKKQHQMLVADAGHIQGILGLKALNNVVDRNALKHLADYFDNLIIKAPDNATKSKYYQQKKLVITYLYKQSSEPPIKQNWKYLGWLITALAISLGAPFWYDLLSKLMQIRGNAAQVATPGTNAGTTTQGNSPTTDQNNKQIRG